MTSTHSELISELSVFVDNNLKTVSAAISESKNLDPKKINQDNLDILEVLEQSLLFNRYMLLREENAPVKRFLKKFKS